LRKSKVHLVIFFIHADVNNDDDDDVVGRNVFVSREPFFSGDIDDAEDSDVNDDFINGDANDVDCRHAQKKR